MVRAALFTRPLAVLLGIFAIVFAIGTLTRGVRALDPLLVHLDTGSVAACLGLGWLGAMLLLSGSPMATISLTLFDQHAIDRAGAMAMIAGSRLGSAFVVLCVGFLHDLRARKQGATTWIGAASFLISATLCLPALLIGEPLLRHERLLDALALPGGVLSEDSWLDAAMAPAFALVERIDAPWLVFVLGVLALLLAFKVFDHALPDLAGRGLDIAPMGAVLYRPAVMFLIGLVVTTLTLSVSVSITVLVPLTAKGYVRRENLIPYIVGANVSTFVDTLAVSLLVEHPHAFGVVLLFMGSVALVALPLVFLFLAPYQRALDRTTRACTSRRSALLAFTLALFVLPVLLLVVGS